MEATTKTLVNPSDITSHPTPIPPPNVLRSKKRKINQQADEAYKVMKRLEGNLKPEDEYDVFGKYIATQIRKLNSERARAQAKKKVSDVLFDMEMSEISEQSRNSSVTPNSIATVSTHNMESNEENSVSVLSPLDFHDDRTIQYDYYQM